MDIPSKETPISQGRVDSNRAPCKCLRICGVDVAQAQPQQPDAL